MKRLFLILLFLSGTIASYAQFQVNPKAGLNFTRQDDQFFQDGKATGAVGWQAGVEFRFGEVFYVAPGLFYFSQAERAQRHAITVATTTAALTRPFIERSTTVQTFSIQSIKTQQRFL